MRSTFKWVMYLDALSLQTTPYLSFDPAECLTFGAITRVIRIDDTHMWRTRYSIIISRVIFRADWAVINPNEDAYLFEDGSLLMILSSLGGFGIKAAQGVVVHKQPLPEADLDANMAFTIGKYEDAEDEIMLMIDSVETVSVSE